MWGDDEKKRPMNETVFPALDPAFVALLCCPNCPERPRLTLDETTNTLACPCCERRYPIIEGLPDLRADDNEQVAAAAADSETKF